MAISFDNDQLLQTLEDAIALARSTQPLPAHWTRRLQKLGELGVKAYIAAIGGALLAKATDARVDSFCQDRAAAPRGYSLRQVAEFLAAQNKGRYDLGTRSKNPLNLRPFLGGPGRIDEFTKIHPRAKPAFDLFVDCLTDLNKLKEPEAQRAFAAFLRLRMAVAADESARQLESARAAKGMSADTLLRVCEIFVRENPEGGRRGQAFVAAVLDCVFAEVDMQPINAPHAGDVRVKKGGRIVVPVEVKQLPVEEDTALALAEDARDLGAESALLVVLFDKHSPLDRERVRARALQHFGVALEICESVRELVSAVAVFAGGELPAILEHLPMKYAARMQEIGVAAPGQKRWRELLAARER